MKKITLIGIIVLTLVLGFAVSVKKSTDDCVESYCIRSNATSEMGYEANTPAEYSFNIVDSNGEVMKDFAITHTKPMHVIVVRKDLKYFQHLHPDFDAETGLFTLEDLNFPEEGVYRIFADFALEGLRVRSLTISEDLIVGSTFVSETLGSEERSKIFDGYEVTLSTDETLESGGESTLSFELKQNGEAVTDLQEYLGAMGHSVILREESLDFIHVHPMTDLSDVQTGTVDFMVSFPEPGQYKIFTQFQHEGKVFTTDFVVIVTQGESAGETMDHME